MRGVAIETFVKTRASFLGQRVDELRDLRDLGGVSEVRRGLGEVRDSEAKPVQPAVRLLVLSHLNADERQVIEGQRQSRHPLGQYIVRAARHRPSGSTAATPSEV